jgi:8-amino-7-oxononanoate synthase
MNSRNHSRSRFPTLTFPATFFRNASGLGEWGQRVDTPDNVNVPEGFRGAGDRRSYVTEFIEKLPAYRYLRRRMSDAVRNGVTANPFFQPRDGVSRSVIRWNGRELINYSGYNYLGLSGHPAVSAAAKNAIDKYGTSASASRIVSGQIDLHLELEKRLARFLGTEDAIVFISGYLTNVTVIAQLVGRPDAVITDSAAHNSIVTGARLSGARSFTFANGEWNELDSLMSSHRRIFNRGLLIAEGLYSMDGAKLDLARAMELTRRHELLLMVDEAHSLGVLGPTGRGICEEGNFPPDSIDVHMGTLSKALASSGGYIAGDGALIEYLRYSCPGLIFSVGLSPADTAAAIAALNVLECETHRPRELRERARFFRQLAREWGLAVSGSEDAPISSLIVGDEHVAVALSRQLLQHGIHVQPIVSPAVSARSARLRFFITLDHTEEQLRLTVPTVARELEQLRRRVG